MRTRAPTRACESTRAVGWMADSGWLIVPSRSAAELLGQALQLLLERPHALEQLGQTRLGHHDPLGQADGPRRRAENLLAGRQARRDAGLRAGDDAVADGDVIGHADLTGEDHAASQPRRAG